MHNYIYKQPKEISSDIRTIDRPIQWAFLNTLYRYRQVGVRLYQPSHHSISAWYCVDDRRIHFRAEFFFSPSVCQGSFQAGYFTISCPKLHVWAFVPYDNSIRNKKKGRIRQASILRVQSNRHQSSPGEKSFSTSKPKRQANVVW